MTGQLTYESAVVTDNDKFNIIYMKTHPLTRPGVSSLRNPQISGFLRKPVYHDTAIRRQFRLL